MKHLPEKILNLKSFQELTLPLKNLDSDSRYCIQRLKYSNNIITFLIKHSDWAGAFKELNQCEFIELNEQLIKEITSKQVKIVFTIVIWVLFSPFMLE